MQVKPIYCGFRDQVNGSFLVLLFQTIKRQCEKNLKQLSCYYISFFIMTQRISRRVQVGKITRNIITFSWECLLVINADNTKFVKKKKWEDFVMEHLVISVHRMLRVLLLLLLCHVFTSSHFPLLHPSHTILCNTGYNHCLYMGMYVCMCYFSVILVLF